MLSMIKETFQKLGEQGVFYYRFQLVLYVDDAIDLATLARTIK